VLVAVSPDEDVLLLALLLLPLVLPALLLVPPLVAGPVVVVVVLEPAALCANDMPGATARKSATRNNDKRRIGRMYFS
jgi:xanthine/uracil permease